MAGIDANSSEYIVNPRHEGTGFEIPAFGSLLAGLDKDFHHQICHQDGGDKVEHDCRYDDMAAAFSL